MFLLKLLHNLADKIQPPYFVSQFIYRLIFHILISFELFNAEPKWQEDEDVYFEILLTKDPWTSFMIIPI